MLISVVTPSFRSGSWLRLCVASVADQGVPVEHIIQDAGSEDLGLERLGADPRVKVVIEPDQGMYDALNRGFRRARGEIFAHLNSDEQYLPGALARVGKFFACHPEVDVLFGDFIVVNSEGEYIFHRRVRVPRKYHTWTCYLPAFTCGMFFRRRIFHELRLEFDPGWRYVGDAEWIVRLLQRRVRMATLGEFTSVFTATGQNLGARPEAQDESKRLAATAPGWARRLQFVFAWHHRISHWARGAYRRTPFSFQLYTRESPSRRLTRVVERPNPFWQSTLKLRG